MRYGFKQFLLLGAIGLSSLFMPKNSNAQSKSKDLPLGQRYYAEKVKAIVADGNISVNEVAQLTYLFKQQQVQQAPVLKKLSKSDAERVLKEDAAHVVSSDYKMDLRELNRGVKDSEHSWKYVHLYNYKYSEKNKSSKDEKEAIFEINPASLDYLVTEVDKQFDQVGMDKDSTRIRVGFDQNPSTSGVIGMRGIKDKYVLDYSTIDLTNLLPDQNLTESGHEITHLSNHDGTNPDNSLERKSTSENNGDHGSLTLTNYNLEALCLQYFSLENYGDMSSSVREMYDKRIQKHKEQEFVNMYSEDLCWDVRNHDKSDPHASTYDRIKHAILDFADELKKEESAPKTTIAVVQQSKM